MTSDEVSVKNGLRFSMAAETVPTLNNESCIIPNFYLYWMQFCGLYAPSTLNNKKKDSISCRCLKLMWTCLLLAALILWFLMDQYEFFAKFWHLLKDVEYFTCVAYQFRSIVKGQGPFVIFVAFCIQSKLTKFLRLCQENLNEILNEDDWKNAHKGFLFLCFCVMLSVLLCLVGILLTTLSLQKTGYLAVNEEVPYFFGTAKLPMGIIGLIQLMCVFFATSCEYLILTLLVTVVIHLRVAFDRLSEKLKYALENVEDIDNIRTLFRTFLTLVELVDRLSEIFAPVLLMSCIKDLFSYAAVWGVYLEMHTNNADMMSGASERSLVYMRGMDYFTYFFADLGLINTLIRVTAFCKLHSSAQSFRARMRMVHLSTANEQVVQEVSRLRQDTSERDGAVTVYGMLELTKDYVVAFFGLAMTYTIFIYDARDSRKGVEELKSSQAAHQQLTVRLLNGSSVA